MKRTNTIVAALCVLLLHPATAAALEVIVGMPYGKHPIGHTAVRVRTFDADREVIFDFGRYGKVWGYLRFHGEGVMRVWRGPQAVAHYLEKQRSFRDSIGYEIAVSPDEERRILAYYEGLLATASWVKDYPLHRRYRLAADYHGVTNQCTSMALEGLKKVLPRARWEAILGPRFNRGQGFDEATRTYFYQVQREKGLDETVVPLDVVDALEDARRRLPDVVVAVRRYDRRPAGPRRRPGAPRAAGRYGANIRAGSRNRARSIHRS